MRGLSFNVFLLSLSMGLPITFYLDHPIIMQSYTSTGSCPSATVDGLPHGQARLPPIRSLFSNQIVFPREEQCQTPVQQANCHESYSSGDQAVVTTTRRVDSIWEDEHLPQVITAMVNSPMVEYDNFPSDSYSSISMNSPPNNITDNGRQTANTSKARNRRVHSVGARHSQMVRNREGRQAENKCMQALEYALSKNGRSLGNRQIVSNQQKSGLKYTKCSNLETAVWYLLVFQPLHHKLRKIAPGYLEQLEYHAEEELTKLNKGAYGTPPGRKPYPRL
ncbi:hypothetical protein K461DRAFT_274676 [Myriangium duriaei CBS 260.36]|uniref:Uncharacterized protein n=1 Tax=Myriangium duriaei CBS 260.36 TaxID=1168546 RepID=A0A9P4J7S0_9PEZI|nr:hypothetical protein K461DRAFT_274676 [Myriangium duriaei CBS 260.36]